MNEFEKFVIGRAIRKAKLRVQIKRACTIGIILLTLLGVVSAGRRWQNNPVRFCLTRVVSVC